MSLLDRLRELFGGRGGDAVDESAEREQILDDRILSTPGEQEQWTVTEGADRERHLDEGDL